MSVDLSSITNSFCHIVSGFVKSRLLCLNLNQHHHRIIFPDLPAVNTMLKSVSARPLVGTLATT